MSAKPYSTFNRTLQNSIVPTALSLSLSLLFCVCVCVSLSLRVSVLALDRSTPMSRATDSKLEEENHGHFVFLFLLLIDLRQCLVQRTPNRRRRITGRAAARRSANVSCNGLQIAPQNTFRKSFTERSVAAARRRRRKITGSAWKNFPSTTHTDGQTLLPLYIRYIILFYFLPSCSCHFNKFFMYHKSSTMDEKGDTKFIFPLFSLGQFVM